MSLNLQVMYGCDLPPPLPFLYSTWIRLATLLAWRSEGRSRYEENEVLTIEMVEQEAANRSHYSGLADSVISASILFS